MRNRKRPCAFKKRNTGTAGIIQLTFLRPAQLADRQQNTDVRLKLNVQNISSENKEYPLQNTQKEGKWNYKCRHWKKKLLGYKRFRTSEETVERGKGVANRQVRLF
jgi:hypothetical protein